MLLVVCFSPNGEPGVGVYHVSVEVKCQTTEEKFLDLIFEVFFPAFPSEHFGVQVKHVQYEFHMLYGKSWTAQYRLQFCIIQSLSKVFKLCELFHIF